MIEQVGNSLVNPLFDLWGAFLSVIPGIIGAIVILLVGYIISAVLGSIVHKVFEKVKLDKWVIEKTKVSRIAGKVALAQFCGLITKWYVFILFLPSAASLIQMQSIADFLNMLNVWIPNLILAIIIAFIGFIGADYVAEKIVETKAKSAKIVADIVSAVIIIFVLIIALRQMKIDISVAENSFLIVLGGIMLTISLALGIGFGLGLKDEAKDLVKKVRKKL